MHHQELAAEVDLLEGFLDLAQVVVDPRADVGIGHGGGGALVLAVFLRQVGGNRDKGLRQMPTQQVTHAALMARVAVSVQEHHRHRRNALLRQVLGQSQHLGFFQGDVDLAGGQHALRDLKAQIALDQRRVLAVAQVEGVGPVDAPDLIDVAKAAGGDQRGWRAAALEHGVDRHRRAVQEEVSLREGHASFVQAGEDAVDQLAWGAQGFAQKQAPLAFVEGGDIGEGAADVGGGAQACMGAHASGC